MAISLMKQKTAPILPSYTPEHISEEYVPNADRAIVVAQPTAAEIMPLIDVVQNEQTGELAKAQMRCMKEQRRSSITKKYKVVSLKKPVFAESWGKTMLLEAGAVLEITNVRLDDFNKPTLSVRCYQTDNGYTITIPIEEYGETFEVRKDIRLLSKIWFPLGIIAIALFAVGLVFSLTPCGNPIDLLGFFKKNPHIAYAIANIAWGLCGTSGVGAVLSYTALKRKALKAPDGIAKEAVKQLNEAKSEKGETTIK